MVLTKVFGFYALGRGALYFLVGAGALVVGTGSVVTGTLGGIGPAMFGVLYLTVAFALFLSGGLLTMERKIGRLLALVLLAVDAAFQGYAVATGGSFFALLFAVCSGVIVACLLVRNPLASGEGRTIDEESNAHEIGVEEF